MTREPVCPVVETRSFDSKFADSRSVEPSSIRRYVPLVAAALLIGAAALAAPRAEAQPAADAPPAAEGQPAAPAAESRNQARPAAAADAQPRAELEAGLAKMLSGATLEGSFTSTGRGGDPGELKRDKYTLGEVRKLAGDVWLFQTRIQYSDKDVTVPLPLPIQWAGDTPVVVVDNVTIPSMGTFSARVMFFEGHYAGYWKHDDRGGHLFGVIRPAAEAPEDAAPADAAPQSGESNFPPVNQR